MARKNSNVEGSRQPKGLTLRRDEVPDATAQAATRHTCTCIHLLEGVNPNSVAMQMGWTSVAFMLETYARFMTGWGGRAMDAALG